MAAAAAAAGYSVQATALMQQRRDHLPGLRHRLSVKRGGKSGFYNRAATIHPVATAGRPLGDVLKHALRAAGKMRSGALQRAPC
jgi:hypothetical protein